jgi:hypothetical protein
MPLVHTAVEQSIPPVHAAPGGQPGQPPPPQSVSVSNPFFTKSVQSGAWHSPIEQTALAQSLDPAQVSPVSHREQVPAPPQSVSVSRPLCTSSVHVGARHWLPRHDALAQSDPESHRLPARQGGHTPPPQSTSASPPFRTESPHTGDAQTLLGSEQNPLVQSRSS